MSNLITGFTPTGEITIGNYLAVIKPLVALQKQHKLFVFCANLHAITEISTTKSISDSTTLLKKNSYKLIAALIACGIDYEMNLLFIQSMNRDHFELFYYLLCLAKLGPLQRMTQFKTKNQQKSKQTSISAGLLTYPCLMAADIFLYKSDIVLVGKDQKQHLEFCRDLLKYWKAKNNSENPFKNFQTKINVKTQKILALDNPNMKMSKSSSNPNSYISLFDNADIVRKKIRAAITDSENNVRYCPAKQPGISNLIIIYSEIANLSISEIEDSYAGRNYCIFKEDLIVHLNTFLAKFQSNYRRFDRIKFLDQLLTKNSKKLKLISHDTIAHVRSALGII